MPKSLKTADEIEGMRQACRLASEVLDMLTPHVKPGITTREIDRIAHDYATQVQQAVPATLGYQPPGYPPYPASLCTPLRAPMPPDRRPWRREPRTPPSGSTNPRRA